MTLESRYGIDFSKYAKDLVSGAFDRMLSQHYNKCVLRSFVKVLLTEVQELYDACIALQKQRTVYDAFGENLDALGRIVGEERAPWTYSEDGWSFFDRQGQGVDQTPVWCIYAPMGVFESIGDAQYRINILTKAMKNHALTGSPLELENLVRLIYGVPVSFMKTGPNTVDLVVPSTVSKNALLYISKSYKNPQVDYAFHMPYPATMSFSGIIMYVPYKFLAFDRDDRLADISPVAVGGIHV